MKLATIDILAYLGLFATLVSAVPAQTRPSTAVKAKTSVDGSMQRSATQVKPRVGDSTAAKRKSDVVKPKKPAKTGDTWKSGKGSTTKSPKSKSPSTKGGKAGTKDNKGAVSTKRTSASTGTAAVASSKALVPSGTVKVPTFKETLGALKTNVGNMVVSAEKVEADKVITQPEVAELIPPMQTQQSALALEERIAKNENNEAAQRALDTAGVGEAAALQEAGLLVHGLPAPAAKTSMDRIIDYEKDIYAKVGIAEDSAP